MKIAVLSPIHWRTPPEKYGPWELVASLITEELVSRGHQVTLFATGDSLTKATLRSVAPYPLFSEEGKNLEHKVYEYLHSALPFEAAKEFDIIHNHYNVYPLAFSQLVQTPVITTMEGFSSPGVTEIMRKYNQTYFVSISMADRLYAPDVPWLANIYHGLHLSEWPFQAKADDYVCYIGRITADKGVHLAVQVARQAGLPLKIAGLMQDQAYFDTEIKPHLKNGTIEYLGEISEQAKKDLVGHAQALIHLNTYPEGFGLTLIEAMAMGTPVIGMNRGSIPEVIADKETGFVVTTAEEAVTAMQALGSISRQACRQRVQDYFTVERMVDGYLAAYRQILEK